MVEDDDMRAVFFDPDDFAVTATITPTGEAAFTVLGIFDARPVDPATQRMNQVGFKGGMDNVGNGPQFRCRTSDVPTVKAGRAALAVAGSNYNVWDVKPDNTGLTTLILKVA